MIFPRWQTISSHARFACEAGVAARVGGGRNIDLVGTMRGGKV
ncbi:hypothetical protein LIG30_3726 [Burkholderia sp. lig30]|nr:hypothetical protein LIG30_3726 [Burkholderia sp. lig30]